MVFRKYAFSHGAIKMILLGENPRNDFSCPGPDENFQHCFNGSIEYISTLRIAHLVFFNKYGSQKTHVRNSQGIAHFDKLISTLQNEIFCQKSRFEKMAHLDKIACLKKDVKF